MSVAEAAPSSSSVDRARVRAVIRWFGRHARDLPWRGAGRSPYGTLVSEAMLQQTQVTRVVDRYTAFVRRFPTVGDLAAADEQDVLAMWSGLGYYRRARALHAAARLIVNECDGAIPEAINDLLRLPGVGRYTAGAIASIGHGRRAPIVDGNVQRVLARWDARDDPVGERDAITWAWRRAESLVDLTRRPGVLNEAMMELGATICTPRAPACHRCPVRPNCEATRLGAQESIPPARPPARRQAVHHHAVVIRRGDRLLVEQRAGDGLWAAMWQTPTVESPRAMHPREIRGKLDYPLVSLDKRHEFIHQTTHRHITFHVYRGTTRVTRGIWRRIDALDELPMSNAVRKLLALVNG